MHNLDESFACILFDSRRRVALVLLQGRVSIEGLHTRDELFCVLRAFLKSNYIDTFVFWALRKKALTIPIRSRGIRKRMLRKGVVLYTATPAPITVECGENETALPTPAQCM